MENKQESVDRLKELWKELNEYTRELEKDYLQQCKISARQEVIIEYLEKKLEESSKNDK